MNPELNYIDINKHAWNKKTAIHLNSEFYNMPKFKETKNALNEIELNLLGDINGKKILHLQCHFGQDTISLQHLGASVTGIDLSDKAIEAAKLLAQELRSDATFICTDLYHLPEILDEKFDIVFTSYGTIGWLPDLNKWAKIIHHFLKPTGRFVFVEFHPVVWMFDDDFSKVAYNYFNDGPIVETYNGTYADRNADIQASYVMWNHSLAEVVSSLIQNNLNIKTFQEFDYSPYNCFKHTVAYIPGKYRIQHLDNKIPMVYALVAQKIN